MPRPDRIRLLAMLALIPLLALVAAAGPAQVVNIGGVISDGSGGPLLGGTVYHANFLTVPAGSTLTVQAGAIVKFGPGSGMDINGTLNVDGTAGNPVIFTSVPDDTAGGDTNGNGPSTGSPTDWRGLRFGSASDASVLRHLVLRYGGHSGWPGIQLGQSDATIENCTVSSCAFIGLSLFNTSMPAVTGCAFVNNGGVAVDLVPIDAVPGFSNLSASGNGGNYVHISVGTTAGNPTIGPANLLGGVLVCAGSLSVTAGTTLTLLAGVVVKIEHYTLLVDVYGTLVCQGTAAAPVVFTSFPDDAFGGDTNGNGPSSGSPTDWRGMRFNSTSDASVLDHAVVRYCGSFGWAGIGLLGSDATLRDCSIQSCAFAGLQVTAGALPAVQRCAFTGNSGVAALVSLNALPGFFNNSASGNGGGDFLQVAEATVSGNRTIHRSNLIGGVFVLGTGGWVPAGATLTLEAGVIVKMLTSGVVFDVNGSLNLLGTGYEPVVFTSFADDAYGGDTNGDGPSTGAPGQWLGIRVQGGSGPSLLEYARLRYGGASAFPLLQCHSSQATLRSIRAEYGAQTGFYLTANGQPTTNNLVAFGCLGDGFLVGGGPYYVQFATSVRNGGAGFRNAGNFFGSVQNTISWTNYGGNFIGITGAQLVNSNGDLLQAGGNGNMFVIPGFVDEAGGDLHLTPNSPLLDTADFGYAVDAVKDHEENSRFLDDDINGVALADRGAYELAFWDMVVTGEPRLGTMMTFTVQSYPGISFYGLGALDGHFQTQPYGNVLVGLQPILLGSLPVGTPLPIFIPDVPSLIGLRVGIQALTFPTTTFFFGSVSRVYRATIRP